MKGLIVCCAVLLLSGCSNRPGDCALGWALSVCSPGTLGYKRYQEKQQAGLASIREKAVIDDLTCQSYGAKPGSDAYVNCRVQRGK